MPDQPFADLSILVVDDEPLLRRRLLAFLERAGAEVTAVDSLAAARQALAALPFEFALVDLNLPDGRGVDLLREGRFSTNTCVVIMTADRGLDGAVEALRLGARDYLSKPFQEEELPLVFQRLRRDQQSRRIEEHRRDDTTPREDEFVFGSSLDALRLQLDRILAADRRMETGLAPVLIQGETGTGKTSIARWIHARGPRTHAALVEVNCSALPETLAESELFGHERGAFTDARTARIGLFEAAHGGSLFLDELASLSLPLQAKVLTAIEDRRIRRVGGNRPIPVDVRLIAAANRDLHELVREGRFREDLLHRLDLFRIQIPPLRQRPSDIPPLAESLMRRACRRHRLDPRSMTPDGLRRLVAYPWPGNVRELAHEIERALIFEDGPLTFSHLRSLTDPSPSPTLPTDPALPSTTPLASPDDWLHPAFLFPHAGFSLEDAIDRLVRKAVDQAQGNVSAAARLLGVSRDVVRYRLEGKGRRSGENSPTQPPSGA